MMWWNKKPAPKVQLWFEPYWSSIYLSADEKILLSMYDTEYDFIKIFPDWFVFGSTKKHTIKTCIFSLKHWINTGEWKYFQDFEVWLKDSYND